MTALALQLQQRQPTAFRLEKSILGWSTGQQRSDPLHSERTGDAACETTLPEQAAVWFCPLRGLVETGAR